MVLGILTIWPDPAYFQFIKGCLEQLLPPVAPAHLQEPSSVHLGPWSVCTAWLRDMTVAFPFEGSSSRRSKINSTENGVP